MKLPPNALIELPQDAVLTGYQRSKNNPYLYDPIYRSASCNFCGTESDFLNAGYAYAYVWIDHYTRRTVEIRK